MNTLSVLLSLFTVIVVQRVFKKLSISLLSGVIVMILSLKVGEKHSGNSFLDDLFRFLLVTHCDGFSDIPSFRNDGKFR